MGYVILKKLRGAQDGNIFSMRTFSGPSEPHICFSSKAHLILPLRQLPILG